MGGDQRWASVTRWLAEMCQMSDTSRPEFSSNKGKKTPNRVPELCFCFDCKYPRIWPSWAVFSSRIVSTSGYYVWESTGYTSAPFSPGVCSCGTIRRPLSEHISCTEKAQRFDSPLAFIPVWISTLPSEREPKKLNNAWNDAELGSPV